jgi:hypothetical protein
MLDPALMRRCAAACLLTAVEKEAWSRNPIVIKRYGHAPQGLDSQLSRARELREAARTLELVADRIEVRAWEVEA